MEINVKKTKGKAIPSMLFASIVLVLLNSCVPSQAKPILVTASSQTKPAPKTSATQKNETLQEVSLLPGGKVLNFSNEDNLFYFYPIEKFEKKLNEDIHIKLSIEIEKLIDDIGKSSSGIRFIDSSDTDASPVLFIGYQLGLWRLEYAPISAEDFTYGAEFPELTSLKQEFEIRITNHGKTIALSNTSGFSFSHTFEEPIFPQVEDRLMSADYQVGPQTNLIIPRFTVMQAQEFAEVSTPSVLPSSPISTNTPSPTPTLAPMDDFMKGVWFANYWKNEFSNPTSDWVLDNVVKPMGVNWVNIHYMCYADNYKSGDIQCGAHRTPTDGDFKHVVETAHKLGLRVYHEIDIVYYDDPDHWHGQVGDGFTEDEWQTWFNEYESFIVKRAALAEELHVDMFDIGSELDGTQHREEDWRRIVAAVRAVYSGPISFSPGMFNGAAWLEISWMDAVDVIGIHPYDLHFSDHDNPTVDEMVTYLQPIVNRLETLSEEYDRPVVITEISFAGIEGIHQGGTAHYDQNSTYEVDLEAQADVYEALIKAFEGRPWWRGVFFGNYGLQSMVRPADSYDFVSSFEKPAENIIRRFYGAEPIEIYTEYEKPKSGQYDIYNFYRDSLREDWNLVPLNGNGDQIELEQSEISVDQNALKVSYDPFSSMWFEPYGNIVITDYDWLEFDLYLEEEEFWDSELRSVRPHNLFLSLMTSVQNWGYESTPFVVEITASPYMESPFTAGRWYHVVIPLADLGPVLYGKVDNISIGNRSPASLTVYFDNIHLLKNK